MNEYLPELWREHCRRYSDNQILIDDLWRELRTHYQAEGRHYHNLNHIEFVIKQLQECRDKIENWNAVVFAAFYHDIVYDANRGDNEERSSALATDRLKKLGADNITIAVCAAHILATSNHNASEDNDTRIFIDADLSILGVSWERYLEYSKNIRQEYIQVPDAIYRMGRRGILMKFLNRRAIFTNTYFVEKYEEQAKENLARELQLLN